MVISSFAGMVSAGFVPTASSLAISSSPSQYIQLFCFYIIKCQCNSSNSIRKCIERDDVEKIRSKITLDYIDIFECVFIVLDKRLRGNVE